TTVPPLTAKGKRLKTSAKVDKPAKEKQHAKSSTDKGLTMLSEVALTEAEHMKLATKRSLTKTHISQASGSGTDKGTGLSTFAEVLSLLPLAVRGGTVVQDGTVLLSVLMSGNKLDHGEHMIIPGKVLIYLVSP
nr:hypothetical protein [Tanacetum cinerariifolium]